jgi:hypothetical protein
MGGWLLQTVLLSFVWVRKMAESFHYQSNSSLFWIEINKFLDLGMNFCIIIIIVIITIKSNSNITLKSERIYTYFLNAFLREAK